MPPTLAVPLLLALLLHVLGQIAHTETGIPPVPQGNRHVLQERQRHVPVSLALLLPWAVTTVAALLAAQLLLAAEAENVPHHVPGYLRHNGSPFLKPLLASWLEVGQLEPNGNSACSLQKAQLSNYHDNCTFLHK